ncbi:MAG: hypothetical protein JNM93_12850 [Bacteriovoracaceae bacterium]|nr:hypothetical protein [Bacteriovoracaceae bacterium]
MKNLLALSLLVFLFQFNAEATFRAGSYNIRNFGSDEANQPDTDKVELAKTIAGLQVDMLGVEEIVDKQQFTQFVAGYFPYYALALSQCGGRGRQHLGIMYNPQRFNLIGLYEDMRLSASGPNSQIDCYQGLRPALIGYFEDKQTSKKFIFMVLHLKAGGDQKAMETRYFQYEVLKVVLNEYRVRGYNDFIIVGDLNSTEYSLGPSNPYYQAFKQIISNLGLYDLTQNLPCTNYWHGGTRDGIEEPSMLDHILSSPSFVSPKNPPAAYVGAHCLANRCQTTRADRLGRSYTNVSDHCPILSDI